MHNFAGRAGESVKARTARAESVTLGILPTVVSSYGQLLNF